MSEPAGQPGAMFAVFRPYPGTVRIELYGPSGNQTTVITFDEAAAREFCKTLNDVVRLEEA